MKIANTHYNIDKIRLDFPILTHRIHQYPLAYLDNASTTQKPNQVLNAIQKFYLESYSNVHRGIHELTEQATSQYEEARQKVKKFINAKHAYECIYVRGATEGINLVVNGFSRQFLKKDDEIIVSQIEHHSNIVPWQLACQYTGAHLKVIDCNDKGELRLEHLAELINKKTRIVAITHISNALGTITPLSEIISLAHQHHIPVLVDGAQAIPHIKIDVQALDCDFYTFSSHKMYGPTGIGILYGKQEWLEKLPPYQGGG